MKRRGRTATTRLGARHHPAISDRVENRGRIGERQARRPALMTLSRRQMLYLLPTAAASVACAPKVASNPTIPSETVVDVRAFGAKGDGRKDDSAAIQAAVRAMRSGNTLYFRRELPIRSAAAARRRGRRDQRTLRCQHRVRTGRGTADGQPGQPHGRRHQPRHLHPGSGLEYHHAQRHDSVEQAGAAVIRRRDSGVGLSHRFRDKPFGLRSDRPPR